MDGLAHHIDTLADDSHYFVIDPSDTKLMNTQIDETVSVCVCVHLSVCSHVIEQIKTNDPLLYYVKYMKAVGYMTSKHVTPLE